MLLIKRVPKERGQPPLLRSAIRTAKQIHGDLNLLIAADKAAWASRRRFGHRRYLLAVYQLNWRWEESDDPARLIRRAAALDGRRLRRKQHPLRALIDLTTSEPNLKIRSRWERALRFVLTRKVPPKKLLAFLREHGGVSGCARFAAYVVPDPQRQLPESMLTDWFAMNR